MPKKAVKQTLKQIMKDVKKLDSDDIRELETTVHDRMKDTYKFPGIRVYGYIPKELADITDTMVQCAFDKGYISKATIFSFTSWAVKLALLKVHDDLASDDQEFVDDEEGNGGS